jgi:hypothetical protein
MASTLANNVSMRPLPLAARVSRNRHPLRAEPRMIVSGYNYFTNSGYVSV